MSKAMYLNWDMPVEDFEEFEEVVGNLHSDGVEIVSCELIEIGEGFECYQVTVLMDSTYDYNYGYAQVLEEYGFDYSGTVGV